MDRVKALAATHPEWKTRQPFKAVIEGDAQALAKSGEQSLLEIVAATHAGITTDAFDAIASSWLVTAKHPTLKMQYVRLVYQPMLEVLAYLRANGFKTFIVSGGGVEFLRVFAESAYGIPPEQVIGSTATTTFKLLPDGTPVLVKEGKVEFMNDGAGKVTGIHRAIGRRPIMAFGNSDGDLEMLQWTAAGYGARFAALIHHTDSEREFAYDRRSTVGKLDRALDAAKTHGWTIVDIRRDWRAVFKSEP